MVTLTIHRYALTRVLGEMHMRKAHRIGLVINTSQSSGYIYMYFDCKLVPLTNKPTNKNYGTKMHSNFLSGKGNCRPKLGLYAGKNDLADDSYLYDFVLGINMADIKAVAGI